MREIRSRLKVSCEGRIATSVCSAHGSSGVHECDMVYARHCAAELHVRTDLCKLQHFVRCNDYSIPLGYLSSILAAMATHLYSALTHEDAITSEERGRKSKSKH